MGKTSIPPRRARVVRMGFDIDAWTRGAILIALTLVVISIVLELTNAFDSDTFVSRALRLFDLNLDDSFNGWYSSMLAAGSAVGAMAASARSDERRIRLGFKGIAGLLLYLSLDEVTDLHTRIAFLIRRLVDPFPGWLVIALIAILLVGLIFSVFLVSLPRPARYGLLIGGVLFVGSAAFIDYLSHRLGFGTAGTLVSIFEEFAEMLGVIIVGRTSFLVATTDSESMSVRDVLTIQRTDP